MDLFLLICFVLWLLGCVFFCYCFFFKQKTAYEMRISDWSSDVCSSDLIARQFSDDIWVCAPAEEQSGAGNSLTLSEPVRLRRYDERRYAVSGTPTDAVRLGMRKVMDSPPDLILSGVNRGANLGDDVTYSGTVSAAIEGALAGIKSIALSQVYAREGMGDDVPFAAATAWGAKTIAPLLNAPLPARTLININFPPLPADQVKGIRIVQI